MRILILGWYGTETIGDRSILLGLLMVMQDAYGRAKIEIGSLFPFLTRRTLLEDGDDIGRLAPGCDIGIVDVKSRAELRRSVSRSDLVVMGGGPLLDIPELLLIRHAFRFAKRKSKATAILGCGIGPTRIAAYSKVIKGIFRYSDRIILRDEKSLQWIGEKCPPDIARRAISHHDPAIIPIGAYLSENSDTEKTNGVAVNFRDYPRTSIGQDNRLDDGHFVEILRALSERYAYVTLVPMHTFCVGGDDREFLSRLALMADRENVSVVQKPLSLFQTFAVFHTASACVGMRYHSIVFQTLLNGNNFVVDYTDKMNGKIAAFLEMIDTDGSYAGRYLSLHDAPLGSGSWQVPKWVVGVLSEGRRAPDFLPAINDTRSFFCEELRALGGMRD